MKTLLATVAALACAGCPGDDDPSWSLVLDGDDLDRVVLSAWGSGPDDVYAVGGGLGNGEPAVVVRFDGSGWSEIDTGSADSFWWTFGLGAGDVYFVGEVGAIYRKQGTQVTRMDTPTTETLYGIWGAASDDLWAVGGDALAAVPTAVILHFDGSAWTDQTPALPFGGALFKIWGSAANDIYACGQGGTILHYDGSAWSAEESGTTASLFTVHGGAGLVYAVGGPPAVVLTRSGGAWVEDDPALPASILNGVAVTPDGSEVVVVGMNGTKFRRAGGAWTDETLEPPGIDLHAVWSEFGETYAVGGNFFAPGNPQTVRIGVVAYYGTDPPPTDL